MKITLKALRANKGLSQIKAAELVGVSEGTWRNWEKGKSLPNASKINIIEQKFDATYNDIIFLQENTDKP